MRSAHVHRDFEGFNVLDRRKAKGAFGISRLWVLGFSLSTAFLSAETSNEVWVALWELTLRNDGVAFV